MHFQTHMKVLPFLFVSSHIATECFVSIKNKLWFLLSPDFIRINVFSDAQIFLILCRMIDLLIKGHI